MRILLLALLLCLAGAPQARAGEIEALDFVKDAEEALEAESYAAAEKLYRRALEEMGHCLPAQHGLGEALLEQDKTLDALVAFRTVLRVAAASEALPSAWETYVTRARRYLAKNDQKGKELEEAVDNHAADLMRLAATYKTRDPDLADRIVDQVLLLRPQHKRARGIRGSMAAKGARKEAVFDGKQVKDWDGGGASWWSVKDGVIVGEANDKATFIRTQVEVTGNFDIVLEARVTEAGGEVPFLALLGAWTAEYDHSRFGVLNKALTWIEYRTEDDKDRVFREPVKSLRKPFDVSRWTVYELRYRAKTIQAYVNGRKVHTIPRPKTRTGGYIGILAQHCRAEIRRVEVLHR